MSSGNGFAISGDTASSEDLSLQGMSVTIIDVIGTVTSADRSGKAKSTERMKVLKIDDLSEHQMV